MRMYRGAIHWRAAQEGKASQRSLVVRRGQPWELVVGLSRPFDGPVDDLAIVLSLGTDGWEGGGTKAVLDLESPRRGQAALGGWKLSLVSTDGAALRLSLAAPPTAPVGAWSLLLRAVTQLPDGQESVSEVRPKDDVHVLFNAWCPEDQVFLGDDEEREEYVLHDVGKIWRGTHQRIHPVVWSYAQFEDGVLEAVLFALERSGLPRRLRGSPVHVSRAVAQIVNADDDRGIVFGKWEGGFAGGTPPTKWTGSRPILEEWVRSGRPAKWGQCWVFAGLVTTVLRCLGVPCRPVTNYSSAHDTNGTCTVDHFVSATDNKPLKRLNTDSVWTFHVWNDAWMARPELEAGLGGWQAVDATPQERSDGLFRVGPAPVAAVKAGRVSAPYDSAFLFAEVNADKFYWAHDPAGRQRDRLLRVAKTEIGRMLLTKRPGPRLLPGNDDRMDITDTYKHNEYTRAERDATYNAYVLGLPFLIEEYVRVSDLRSEDDVKLELDLRKSALIGEPLTASVWATNESRQPRRVRLHARLYSCDHRGRQLQKLKRAEVLVELGPGETTETRVGVAVAEYLGRLGEEGCVKVWATAVVEDTVQMWAAEGETRLAAPELAVDAPDIARVGEKVRVGLSFRNPLPSALSGCSFLLDGPGLLRPEEFDCPDVRPRGLAQMSFQIQPWRPGLHTVLAHFSSHQLFDVNGSAHIRILD